GGVSVSAERGRALRELGVGWAAFRCRCPAHRHGQRWRTRPRTASETRLAHHCPGPGDQRRLRYAPGGCRDERRRRDPAAREDRRGRPGPAPYTDFVIWNLQRDFNGSSSSSTLPTREEGE